MCIRDRSSVPVLVASVRKKGLLFAHVVPHKGGSHKEVIKLIIKDLTRCGFYGKVILKGDQEPAIEDLMREVARARGSAETVLEFSPVRDSSGNGLAEKGVQTLEGLIRTHILELDEKLNCKLSLDMAWFNWLVEYCADVHNRHQVGADGKTPWERLKGRRCHGYVQEFGRVVLHRVPGVMAGG